MVPAITTLPNSARRADDAWRSSAPRERSATRRYGIALLATALAVAGAHVIDLPLDVDTNLLLLAAVSISAWYGGRWPGITSALLSAIAIWVVFIPDSEIAAAHGLGEFVYVGAFLTVSLVVSGTAGTLHRARRAAEYRVGQLQAAAAQITNLQAMTRALSEAKTVGEVSDVLLERGLDVVQATAGIVATLDGEAFTSVRARGLPPELSLRLRALSMHDDVPLVRAARTRQPVSVDGVDGAQSSLALPLESGGDLIGAIELTFTGTSALPAGTLALSAHLAQTAADSLARARHYDDERAARHRAELLARARSDVLGVVAHDLRNPIHSIVACTELLMEESTSPEERRQLLEVSRRAAMRMNRLVGDLLDATQLQAGHLSLALSDVDACGLIRDAEEAWRDVAADGRVAFDVDCDPAIGAVRADHDRMLQVLGNLIGNAIKFAGAGGRVTIAGRALGDEIEFRVRDTGPGIPDSAMRQLFERFWQADTQDRRGIGLGLAIAKGIIDAHGGHIAVHTKLGAGTTFSFTLARVAAAAAVRVA